MLIGLMSNALDKVWGLQWRFGAAQFISPSLQSSQDGATNRVPSLPFTSVASPQLSTLWLQTNQDLATKGVLHKAEIIDELEATIPR